VTRRKDWIDKETPGRKPGSHNRFEFNRLCLRCRTPYWSTRFDSVTCSVRCRVWLHRHPEVLEAAAGIARHNFPPSRGAQKGWNPEGKRYAVGQWLHFLATKDEVDTAFEMIARTAYPRDKSRWKTLGEDRRRRNPGTPEPANTIS
jgi:hypothetical protein